MQILYICCFSVYADILINKIIVLFIICENNIGIIANLTFYNIIY